MILLLVLLSIGCIDKSSALENEKVTKVSDSLLLFHGSDDEAEKFADELAKELNEKVTLKGRSFGNVIQVGKYEILNGK